MASCDVCQGRGVVVSDEGVTKPCICSIKRQLQLYLKPVLQYKTRKDLDFEKLSKIQALALKDGTRDSFHSLVKSFLVYSFISRTEENPPAFELVTSSDIVERYVGEGQTHIRLYTLPLVFLDISTYYPNKAMGEIILYILKQRADNKKPTWVYRNHMKDKDLMVAYGSLLIEYISTSFTELSLKKFEERSELKD